jgi:uncharacterized protein
MDQILGGVLIGVSATIMLLFSGRVTGISGIVGGLLSGKTQDKDWRLFFILGLFLGGYTLKILRPDFFINNSTATTIDYLIAGFFVGFGTLLGNGCTSGHGVCGISRLSSRSIIATVTFILAGIMSVLLFKALRGEL